MSLAIAEKRQTPQRRPGGCAGIFFQLFDWNRRLAKKKLFSKKLLPPVRAAKRASKRFAGDDKMPVANKLLLIADENRGGFPSSKKPEAEAFRSSSPDGRGNNGMRAPGLVARLMGLESMPVVQHDEPRRALDSGSLDDLSGSCGYSRLDQGLCEETAAQGKLDLRPQKLRKTGGFLELERRMPVGATWLSPEVLSKNMLSRSKRQQHRQLTSPVKSPRLLSRSSTARLVQAATKILEPGLQSRNRDRFAITYTAADMEGSDATLGLKNRKEPSNDSLVGSCRSCGSLVEVSEVRLGAMDSSNASSSHDGFVEGKMKAPVPPSGRSGPNRTASTAVQAKINVQSRAPVRRRSDQEQCRPWQDATPKSTPKVNNLRPNRSPLVKDQVLQGTKVCSRKLSETRPIESKNFVTLNGNLNDSSRRRPAAKASNHLRVEMGRNGWEKSTARKRRPAGCPQADNVAANSSTFAKQRSVGNDSLNRKGAGRLNNRPINYNCVDSESWKKADGDSSGCTNGNSVVSFTFSSQMRHRSSSLANQGVMGKSRDYDELTRDTPHSKFSVSNAKIKTLSSQRETTLQGDQLSNILEQKIKELTSLGQDELARGHALPERSTASILEELISALTTEAPISQKSGDRSSDGNTLTDNICHGCDDLSDCTLFLDQMLAISREFQEEPKAGISASFLASECDQPSPISILDASFSNDSCSLGSPSCSSGGKPHLRLTEGCGRERKLDLDTDLSDSATSIITKNSDTEKIADSIDKKSSMHGSRSCGVGILVTKLSHSSEAIRNAELLFENGSLYESDGTSGPSIDSFLLNSFEAILDAFYINPKCGSSFTEAEGNKTRELLFDSIIECLDSKYSCFCESGYRAWSKLRVLLSRNRLMREVHDEIRGWRDLVGKNLDDLIEKDFTLSTLKWTVFQIEVFESGIEIESDILQALVDEVVMDLCL